MNINKNMSVLSRNINPLHFGESADEPNVDRKYYNRVNSTILEANRQRYILGRELEDGYISNRKYKKEVKKINKWEQKTLSNTNSKDDASINVEDFPQEKTGFFSKLLNIFIK